MVDEFGRILCNECKMDLCAYPEDYEDGGKNAWCGHCLWGKHVCPEERFEAIIRGAIRCIRKHENDWLRLLRAEVPSYDPEENPADDGEDTDNMDYIQNEQAHDAQVLLRELLKEFEGVSA
ncbi:hypothetical protein AB0M57_23825 [Streptomyces sp. NPDC051597]|uniref:hypothetical protein n=1 Tax=Streptomyces sp. NPDC051597 TaxID=3155049 RepID=UPI00343DA37B